MGRLIVAEIALRVIARSNAVKQSSFLHRSDGLLRFARNDGVGAKPIRGPSVQAARNWLLIAAALGRDVKACYVGIGDHGRKIPWLKKQLWLGMNRVERFLGQGEAQLVGAAGERG